MSIYVRLLAAAAVLLGLCLPANAARIMNVTITAPVTNLTTSPVVFRENPDGATVQCNFTYGSSGTTVDAWIQTSFDGQTTWVDIMNFHFLLASKRGLMTINSDTPIIATYTATDGTLANDTAKDGLLATPIRVKYTTTGTYAGGTTLQCDMTVQKSRTQ